MNAHLFSVRILCYKLIYYKFTKDKGMDNKKIIKSGWAFSRLSGAVYSFEHIPLEDAEKLKTERDQYYVLETINWTFAESSNQKEVHHNKYFVRSFPDAIALAATMEIHFVEIAEDLVGIRRARYEEMVGFDAMDDQAPNLYDLVWDLDEGAEDDDDEGAEFEEEETEDKSVINEYGCVAQYKYSRLCFKADVIEPLNMEDKFCVATAKDGTFVMTKREFYETFPNVVKTDSHLQRRVYHMKTPPQKALKFRVQ
jgi:hypothetical protein